MIMGGSDSHGRVGNISLRTESDARKIFKKRKTYSRQWKTPKYHSSQILKNRVTKHDQTKIVPLHSLITRLGNT